MFFNSRFSKCHLLLIDQRKARNELVMLSIVTSILRPVSFVSIFFMSDFILRASMGSNIGFSPVFS